MLIPFLDYTVSNNVHDYNPAWCMIDDLCACNTYMIDDLNMMIQICGTVDELW